MTLVHQFYDLTTIRLRYQSFDNRLEDESRVRTPICRSLSDIRKKNIFLDGTIVTVPGSNNRCFFEAIAKEVGQPVDTVISNYKSHLMQSDRARYFYDKDLHQHFPELHVGRKVRKSH